MDEEQENYNIPELIDALCSEDEETLNISIALDLAERMKRSRAE